MWGDGMKAIKIIFKVVLFLAGIALLCFLGWLGYQIYNLFSGV